MGSTDGFTRVCIVGVNVVVVCIVGVNVVVCIVGVNIIGQWVC